MADPLAVLAILVASSFVPPLVFLAWVRRSERYGKEPWGRVARTFLWGAVFAVLIAIVLSLVLLFVYQEFDRVYVLSGRFANVELVVTAMVIAPFAEELAKGGGVYLARRIIDEPEDGIVYGAASGFGFAASENLLYGMGALAATGSLQVSLLVIGVRSVSSALLHASATATFGYGIAVKRIWPERRRAWPYYFLAVAMHATYNFLGSLGELYADVLGDAASFLGLAGAIGLAIAAFAAVRGKAAKEDRWRVAW